MGDRRDRRAALRLLDRLARTGQAGQTPDDLLVEAFLWEVAGQPMLAMACRDAADRLRRYPRPRRTTTRIELVARGEEVRRAEAPAGEWVRMHVVDDWDVRAITIDEGPT